MKHSRSHSRKSKKHTLGKKKRGGVGNAQSMVPNYGSASNYSLATVGEGNTQYQNVFGPGEMYPHSNALVSLDGRTLGGKRRKTRKHNKRGKKGGFLSGVISQAIVPFSLLGMQQSFGKRKTMKKH
jgi:hypothetical protein